MIFTADGEIWRRLLLGRKDVTNLDSMLKRKGNQFANKGPYSQPYGLSSSHIQLWELDHKEGREAKNWRFWTVVLRIPWIAERSNPSILKAINPEYSLEGLMLKLELQYFGHLKWTAESKEKTLVLGKIEGGRKRGWQRLRWLDGIADAMDTYLGKHQEMVGEKEAWGAAVHGVTKSQTHLQLSNLAQQPWISTFLYLDPLIQNLHSLLSAFSQLTLWSNLKLNYPLLIGPTITGICLPGLLENSSLCKPKFVGNMPHRI